MIAANEFERKVEDWVNKAIAQNKKFESDTDFTSRSLLFTIYLALNIVELTLIMNGESSQLKVYVFAFVP